MGTGCRWERTHGAERGARKGVGGNWEDLPCQRAREAQGAADFFLRETAREGLASSPSPEHWEDEINP